jgi:hypothetical protein
MLLIHGHRRRIESVVPEQLSKEVAPVSGLQTSDDAQEFLRRFCATDSSLRSTLVREMTRIGSAVSHFQQMTDHDLIAAAASEIASRRLQLVSFLDESPGVVFDGETGSNGGGAATKTSVQCPKVEINISDAILPLKGLAPATEVSVSGRIRAVGRKGSTNIVVLTNPDGRLRFASDTDIVRQITLPANENWVSFEISGAKGSDALKDAVIEVHCETATGPLIAKTAVTVFWFDDAHINITANGKYAVAPGDVRYTVLEQGGAVKLEATARIRPANVDCNAAQIRDLRLAIMQNSLGPRSREVLYGPPTMTWEPDASGASVNLPKLWRRAMAINQTTNDSTDASAPFYALPKGAQPKPPRGCPGGGGTISQDNPGTALHGSLHIRVTDGGGRSGEAEPVTDDFGLKLENGPVIGGKGKTLGTAEYPFQKVIQKQKFITWAVIENIKTNKFTLLKQRGWTLDLDSSKSDNRAAPDAAEADPSVAPVTGPPFSNTLNDDKRNWSNGPVAGATVPVSNP